MSSFNKYKPKQDRTKLIESVTLNIKAILSSGSIEKHKRDLLDICIWQLTEVDGKWNTRFRSEGAQTKENWDSVQHEHVFQRRNLISRLINEEKISDVILDAVPCLVTPQEHKFLTSISKDKNIDGWLRYKACGIRVFDLLTNTEYDFT